MSTQVRNTDAGRELYERLIRAATPPGHTYWINGRMVRKPYTGKGR